MITGWGSRDPTTVRPIALPSRSRWRRSTPYADGLAHAVTVAADTATVAWPPLDAQALFWLGMLQSRTGAAEASATTLERAMRRAAEARDDALFLRAGTKRAYVLGVDLGRTTEALKLGALPDPLVTRAGDDPETRARLLDNVGVVLRRTGAYAEAEDHFERAGALYTQALGPDHPNVAAVQNGLGNVLDDEGHYDEARRHYEQGLQIKERTLGAQHPRTAIARYSLGIVLQHQGNYADALASVEAALAVLEGAYGADLPAQPGRRAARPAAS